MKGYLNGKLMDRPVWIQVIPGIGTTKREALSLESFVLDLENVQVASIGDRIFGLHSGQSLMVI